MPQLQGNSSSAGGRLDGTLQKRAVVAGDFVVGAGWGTASVFALGAGSTDQRGTFTITASTTGLSQATATLVLTFADGAYAATPIAFCIGTNDNSIDTGRFKCTVTTTVLTMTHSLLPVDTKVYSGTYVVIQ